MYRRVAFPVAGALILLVGLLGGDQSASAAPALQLPWPTGEQHRINGGWTYGCPSGYPYYGTHNGSNYYAIDFVFSVGQNVSATAAGTVMIAAIGDNDGAGNYLAVDHGGGFVSRYLHLRLTSPFAPGIGVGASVSQGQLIGYSGNTGGVAAHLHFDLKLNGAAYKAEPMSGVTGFGWYGFSVESGLGCGSNGHDPSPYWTSRHPTDVQKVTDSTGDGRDDAVVFYQGPGQWYVTPSTGSSFGAISQWISAHGIGSRRQFAADVNGDFRTDSVVWFAEYGSWWVSLSTGSQYLPYTRWATGHGIGSHNQFLADVNVDGRADAVVFFAATGQWYVALANASATGFNQYTEWTTGHGIRSQDQLLADVTGDLRADSIVWFGDGRWYVAAANTSGAGFNQYTLWVNGHGIGSDRRFAADVDGDLDADAVVYFGGTGAWYAARANPPLQRFDQYTLWISGHGIGSDNQMLADANGDAGNKADAIIYIGRDRGEWWVGISTGSGFSTPTQWRSGSASVPETGS